MDEDLPALPYDGSSGWSGTESSRERAEHMDKSGKTKRVQSSVLKALSALKEQGGTWRELESMLGIDHHGTTSGALSTLDKRGKVALLDEKREGSHVYVLPEHVNGRELAKRRNRVCRNCGARQ